MNKEKNMEQIKTALYIVSTPIGNLEDMTFRAVYILSNVDYILAEDTRKTKILLDHYNIQKQLISFYSYVERRKIPEIISRMKEGSSYALVTDAGTPGVSDPAFNIIRAAIDVDIEVIHIPGASAFISSLVISGLPFDRFIFEGFLPLKKGRNKKLNLLKEEERTIVFYESPHRIIKTLKEIFEIFGDRRVAICRELTKKFEEVIRGKLSEILLKENELKQLGEFCLVVEGTKGLKEEKEVSCF
jgi:16S rRNA (cytidine1402-2'-O)-methyltransferase